MYNFIFKQKKKLTGNTKIIIIINGNYYNYLYFEIYFKFLFLYFIYLIKC